MEYEALYNKLQLSVDILPEYHPRLQDCFFYFAAFPEDFLVPIEEIVKLWVAEGLVQSRESSAYSCLEQAHILVGILVAKSMIHLAVSGVGESFCKIHDVMRDLAQRNLKKDVSARVCLYAPGLRATKLPKDWISAGVELSAKRLSFRENDLRRFPEPETFKAPHLEVLILKGNRNLGSLSTGFLQEIFSLKVLDLSNTLIGNIGGTWWRTLRSLILLDLSGCEALKSISNEIGELQDLKFLDLSRCLCLENLSNKVGGLGSLESLNLNGCEKLEDIPGPNELGGLQNVELLDFKSCFNLQSLPKVRSLTNLRSYSTVVPPHKSKRFRILGGWSTECDLYELPSHLRQLHLIESFDLGNPVEKMPDRYMFNLAPLSTREILYLRGIKPFPAGVAKLHRLKVLTITNCYYETPVPALEKLPHFEDLRMGFPFLLHTATKEHSHL